MGEDAGIYGGDFGTSVGECWQSLVKTLEIHQFQRQPSLVQLLGLPLQVRPIVDLTFMDFITIALTLLSLIMVQKQLHVWWWFETPVTFRVASGSGIGSAAQHHNLLSHG